MTKSAKGDGGVPEDHGQWSGAFPGLRQEKKILEEDPVRARIGPSGQSPGRVAESRWAETLMTPTALGSGHGRPFSSG